MGGGGLEGGSWRDHIWENSRQDRKERESAIKTIVSKGQSFNCRIAGGGMPASMEKHE